MTIVSISFLPSLKNSYVNWDDETIFTKNPYVLELTRSNVQKYFSIVDPAYPLLHIPLTLLSFSIENHFFGLNPFVQHLTNLILHLFNCALAFLLIYLLSRNLWVGFITALLFGIHPLNVESVAWVTERKDVLYAFFLLGAMITYFWTEKKRVFYLLSILLFMLSLLSKPTGVYLPFVLILMDWLQGKKLSWQAIVNKIPFFIIAGIFTIPFIGTQQHLIADNLKIISKCGGELICMVGLVGFGVSKLVLPYKLACSYPFPSELTQFSDYVYLMLPVFGVSALALVLWLSRHSKKILFGIIFFLIALAPYLASLPYFGIYFCDHYTYLASLGWFYAISEIARIIYEKYFNKNSPRKLFFYSLVVTAILFLSFLTWNRCGVWKDSLTLWSDLIAKYPNYPDAYYARSKEHSRRGDHENALSDLNKWARLAPDNSAAYYLRGLEYLSIGENKKALLDFDRTIQLSPRDAAAYNGRGIAYFQTDGADKAILDFNKAIQIRPDYGRAYFNRAIAFLKMGDHQKAENDFKTASTYNADLRKEIPGIHY